MLLCHQFVARLTDNHVKSCADEIVAHGEARRGLKEDIVNLEKVKSESETIIYSGRLLRDHVSPMG